MNDREQGSRDPGKVRAMFDGIARRYDFANHLLSAGIDLRWRRRAALVVRGWNPKRILDLASGSGDLALTIARECPDAEIIASDFSAEMLEVARGKGVRNTVVADALALPFDQGRFDVVTVAFGLRNMADWGAALREMRRVLQPGGHVLILDFAIPPGPLRIPYRFYLHRCLPLVAALVTGRRDAYEYLGGSIEQFPSGRAMQELICANGFEKADAVSLTGGIAMIYTATASAIM